MMNGVAMAAVCSLKDLSHQLREVSRESMMQRTTRLIKCLEKLKSLWRVEGKGKGKRSQSRLKRS